MPDNIVIILNTKNRLMLMLKKRNLIFCENKLECFTTANMHTLA